MIDLSQVGTHTSRNNDQITLNCGIYLKGISPDKGYALRVRVIHELDQFHPDIPATNIDLNYVGGEFGLWQVDVDLNAHQTSNSHFSQPGRYVYRYQLSKNNQVVVNWFADPFARHSSVGTFSLFDTEGNTPFEWSDDQYKVVPVDDMLVYELMVAEFNNNFDGVLSRLDYLTAIGVNVIELMPITNVKEAFRWGYMPLSYFAPEERYGGAASLKQLVNACHERGIAVILDAVYAHAHPQFPYNLVYNLTAEPNPMMGPFAEDMFGPGTNFEEKFTREFFLNVNQYWINEYHVDGFRYDYVPGFYRDPMGPGYANLVYQTYEYTIEQEIPRFDGNGYSRLIQCAEYLPDPQAILQKTYTNCCWQDELMNKSFDMARYNYVDDKFAHQLGLIFKGYPDQYHNPASGESFPVNVFQYIETHDHSRLITQFGLTNEFDILGQAFGDRNRWYKLQPYVIGLYTCRGIPMLWNGQEIGENYSVPNDGIGRVFMARPLHWEHFYDDAGQGLIRLYRKLAILRREQESLRSRETYYFNNQSIPTRGVVIYQRGHSENDTSTACIVFLNFGDQQQTLSFTFPLTGVWQEVLENQEQIISETIHQSQEIQVPSNYGKIFRRQPS